MHYLQLWLLLYIDPLNLRMPTTKSIDRSGTKRYAKSASSDPSHFYTKAKSWSEDKKLTINSDLPEIGHYPYGICNVQQPLPFDTNTLLHSDHVWDVEKTLDSQEFRAPSFVLVQNDTSEKWGVSWLYAKPRLMSPIKKMEYLSVHEIETGFLLFFCECQRPS